MATQAAPEPGAEWEVHVEDVEYQRQGERPFLARVYRPHGRGPFPTLIDVHGGAWHSGDRRNNAAIDHGLAARGILVAAIDFRQSRDAPCPASLIDVNLGVRWLKAHATKFNGTPAVGGLGSSSGGHQILLTALRPTAPTSTPAWPTWSRAGRCPTRGVVGRFAERRAYAVGCVVRRRTEASR